MLLKIYQEGFQTRFVFYAQGKHLIDSNQPEGTMCGAYPQIWMILCNVMLHTQFVGITCGAYGYPIIPTYATYQAL